MDVWTHARKEEKENSNGASCWAISVLPGILSATLRLNFSDGVKHLPAFPGGSEVKASACNAGDLGSIPGSGRSSGEGNGNPLQNSCLGNPRDRGAWRSWADYSPWGRKESDTAEPPTLLLLVVKARVPAWAPCQH